MEFLFCLRVYVHRTVSNTIGTSRLLACIGLASSTVILSRIG